MIYCVHCVIFVLVYMYDLALGRYNVDHLKNKFGPAQLDYETDPGDFGSSALKRKVGR